MLKEEYKSITQMNDSIHRSKFLLNGVNILSYHPMKQIKAVHGNLRIRDSPEKACALLFCHKISRRENSSTCDRYYSKFMIEGPTVSQKSFIQTGSQRALQVRKVWLPRYDSKFMSNNLQK